MRATARLALAVALGACGACGAQDTTPPAPESPSAPAPTTPAERRSPTRGAVNLTFRGAIVLAVVRPGADCAATTLDGKPWVSYGGKNAGHPDEPFWWLTAIDDDADGPHPPSVVLNLRSSSETYTWRRDGGTVKLAPDLSRAVFDVELHRVSGTGTVRVKGTIDCTS